MVELCVVIFAFLAWLLFWASKVWRSFFPPDFSEGSDIRASGPWPGGSYD